MYIWHRIVNKSKDTQSCQADETTSKTAISNVSCRIMSQVDMCIIISIIEEKFWILSWMKILLLENGIWKKEAYSLISLVKSSAKVCKCKQWLKTILCRWALWHGDSRVVMCYVNISKSWLCDRWQLTITHFIHNTDQISL